MTDITALPESPIPAHARTRQQLNRLISVPVTLLMAALTACGEPASGAASAALSIAQPAVSPMASGVASPSAVRSLPAWATPPAAEALGMADPSGRFRPGPDLREVGWDSFPLENDPRQLVAAIDHQLAHVTRSGKNEFAFGRGRIAKGRLITTLLELRTAVIEDWGRTDLAKRLAEKFHVFQSRGLTGIDDVLFTGYFLPVYEASSVRSESFPVPLYARPPERNRRRRIADHAAIDRGSLKGRGLEVAWVRSKLDRFFLMVQGSGVLVYPDGTRRSARYSGGNGRPYTAIGRLLVEDGHIPREEISMQRIRQFLARRPDLEDAYLHRCASFVFFRIDNTPPLGLGSIPLTADVSVATDPRVFGPGLVGIADYPRPTSAPTTGPAPTRPAAHIVLAQDAGGAIKGPGHIDIFTGEGDAAAIPAGFLNHSGRLFFLVSR